MTLSDEGVRLLMRAALVAVVILVAAFFRTLVGTNPKRHGRLTLGTIGGMAAGIAVADPLSQWAGWDVSTLTAVAGIFAGWAVAYQFVRHLPRNAS